MSASSSARTVLSSLAVHGLSSSRTCSRRRRACWSCWRRRPGGSAVVLRLARPSPCSAARFGTQGLSQSWAAVFAGRLWLPLFVTCLGRWPCRRGLFGALGHSWLLAVAGFFAGAGSATDGLLPGRRRLLACCRGPGHRCLYWRLRIRSRLARQRSLDRGHRLLHSHARPLHGGASSSHERGQVA